ncbi:hypothetical protein [Nevskia sp.]|uniref:hypothetical protein n=1 Tax=Nevskia sp. TaxID=1929292 RepID=UPI0025FD5DA1|nr:hypothetical protein [Nevskia sp.]
MSPAEMVVVKDRAFTVLAKFSGENRAADANQFMEAHPDAGLILESNGVAYLASMTEKGIETRLDDQLKGKMIGLLINERATDLSDEEIERCTQNCAAGWVGRQVRLYRDCGFLKWEEVNSQ